MRGFSFVLIKPIAQALAAIPLGVDSTLKSAIAYSFGELREINGMPSKFVPVLLLSAWLATTAQAAETTDQGPYLRLKVLGNTGFVLNRLKGADTKIVTSGSYDYLVVGPNVIVDDNVRKAVNTTLSQGGKVLFDNQIGLGLASENAQHALGMSLDADALVVSKPKSGSGLLMTPVDRPRVLDTLSESKLRVPGSSAGSGTKQGPLENTIENVFGL